jgi:apolipoprotein N-acyltransferase
VAREPSLLLLPADRPRISQLIFFVLGCLTTLAFAPFGWSLLVPLVLVPFLYVCLTNSPRDSAKHGFWFGFGMFLTGTYWVYISVAVFGQAPTWIALLLMLALVLLMSFYLWITGWLISRLAHGEPWFLLAVAPAVWVVVEWARGWLITGFPWMSLGYSQVDSALAGWAPVLGVYGVSALMVLSTAAILVAIMTRGRQQMIAVGLVLLPGLVGAGLRTVDWTEPDGEPLTATIIQGGISQDKKWLIEQFQPTLDFYRNETRKAAGSDIVVWPEVAIPAATDRVEGYILGLESDSRINEQTILFGILERVTERTVKPKVHNAIIAVNGEERQVYRKRHLVPFGEYFPVPAAVREWMRMMSLPHNDLTAGDDVQPLIHTLNGVELAVAICYEDAYGAEQLYAMPDAGILINVSNDAWFGGSIASHQHLEIARMRSLEVGRHTIRATSTGISAFIGPKGNVLESGQQFVPVTITRRVQPYKGGTPYSSVGNRLVLGIAFLIVAGFWLRGRVNL